MHFGPNDILVLTGNPDCCDVDTIVTASRDTLEETIMNLVEKDEVAPEEISVWLRAPVEAVALACRVNGLGQLDRMYEHRRSSYIKTFDPEKDKPKKRGRHPIDKEKK